MKFLQLFFLLFFSLGSAQEGFRFQEQVKKEVIPFQLINNLIFIPITVNGVELTFLLDTGVAESLLFSLESKELKFYDVEKVKFSGLGGNTEIEGLKSINNIVQVGNNLKDYGHTIFVILNEEFNFSSHVGIPVNGIIGYHFFKNHPVKIDYITKRLTVYSNSRLAPKETRKFSEIPITLELNKPYLTAGVEQTHEKKDSKLLVDLGNSDPLWLFPSLIADFQYNRPNIDDFLGRGFNGDIYGKRSRIHRLYLQNFIMEKPLMAMPDEFSIQHLNLVKDRKGSLGSEILRRFTVIVDYPNRKLYLKKNRNFQDPFHFNMSGLDIKHDGMFWDKDIVKVANPSPRHSENATGFAISTNEFQYLFTLKPEYSVAGSRTDSPAYRAGIRKGDKITRVNGGKAADMKLEQIMSLMKSEAGKRITVEVDRSGQIMKFSFYLEDPVPYTDSQ